MDRTVPQFEVIGEIPDGAMAALARMLLDLADRDLRGELESAEPPPQNGRAARALETPKRLSHKRRT